MKYLKLIGLCALTALAINSIAVQANAGNLATIVEYEPNVPVPEGPPPFNWSGPYIGVHAGAAFTSQTSQYSKDIYETDWRDVTEDQCWKFWNNDWNRQIDDRYCSGGFEGMNQHYYNHAKTRPDVVIGSEEYERYVRTDTWEETTREDFAIYGLHAGYLKDFGTVIGGIEVSHTFYNSETFPINNVTSAVARVGLDLGRVSPYALAGYSWAGGVDEGMTYGGGIDWAVTDSLVLGALYKHHEFAQYPHDVAMLTASVGF